MKIVVSLHDVHPSSLVAVARQRAELRAAGARHLSLLVVPNWHGCEPVEHDPAFVSTLSQWRNEGDEILLHGWTHSCVGLKESPRDWFWTRLYTAREAEFMIASPREARLRLTTGRALLEQLGWPVVGFIAPAWLMAPHVVKDLQDLGFAYTTTRKTILPLGRDLVPVRSPSLCYSTRSAWRCLMSSLWNPLLARSVRRLPLMRVSLHPGDLEHPSLWRQVLRLIEGAMKAGRTSTTYGEFIANTGRVMPASLRAGTSADPSRILSE